MIGTLVYDDKKNIVNTPSLYRPGKEIVDFISKIRQDFEVGLNILNQPYLEFNNRSLIQYQNDCQKAYNSYRESASTDPDEAWRANVVRPMTRNKIVGTAAQVTANLLYPKVFAQNDEDDDDVEAGLVMRDLVEWNIVNSDYEQDFIFAVMAALINPAVIVKTEYLDILQKVKEAKADGSIAYKEVKDELMSGLRTFIVPCEELLIANVYEYSLQNQRFLIRRRFIDYEEARSLYGEHSDFSFVQPGVRIFFSDELGNFYEQKDDENPTLVEEVVYYNRVEDLEVPIINGIYLGKPNPEANLMKHRRAIMSNGEIVFVPVYPFSKSGYEPIDERRFFYYKSAVDKLAPEQEVLDKVYRMSLDAGTLLTIPPIAVLGDEDLNAGMMIPGSTHILSKNTSVQNLAQHMNLNAGLSLMDRLERSMTESSHDELLSGISSTGGRTAFERARQEQNAKIQLGLFGRMIGTLVRDLGYLMIDLILRYQTVGEVDEITGGNVRMKFRSFVLHDRIQNGRKISKKIELSDSLMGTKLSKKQLEDKSFALLERSGGMKSHQRIIQVNPEAFAKLRFLIRVEPDELLPKNEVFERAMKLEAYASMIKNPILDQEAVTKDFLVEPVAPGESEKYLKKQSPMQLPMQIPGTQPETLASPGSQVSRTVQANALSGLLG